MKRTNWEKRKSESPDHPLTGQNIRFESISLDPLSRSVSQDSTVAFRPTRQSWQLVMLHGFRPRNEEEKDEKEGSCARADGEPVGRARRNQKTAYLCSFFVLHGVPFSVFSSLSPSLLPYLFSFPVSCHGDLDAFEARPIDGYFCMYIETRAAQRRMHITFLRRVNVRLQCPLFFAVHYSRLLLSCLSLELCPSVCLR